MESSQTRRKRRRKPTLNPRFDSSRVALEIGLIRLALKNEKDEKNKKAPRPT